MTVLRVEPSALTAYATQLDRARGDAGSISGYITRNATDGTGGELFSLAQEGNDHAVEAVSNTFTRLTCLLETSAPELRASATYYRDTDLEAAIDLDRALPPAWGQCPTPLEYEIAANVCEPGLFQDGRAPESHLVPPSEPDNPTNTFGFMDYLSPASWIQKGLDTVFGFDPIADMQNKMFGDWEIFAKMPEVLANANGALHDTATNLQSGATTLNEMWLGNAGAAAYRYFTDLATAVDGLRSCLEQLADEYRTMSDAVWAAGEAIGAALKAMIDAAIIGTIAWSAGTATAASGVGLGVGYTLAAIQGVNIMYIWNGAMALYQNANAAVMVFRAGLNRTLSDLDSISLPVIGGGAGYDHPLAGARAHA